MCCAGGLVPHWTRDLREALRPINAKSETAARSPLFSPASAKRALVPVAQILAKVSRQRRLLRRHAGPEVALVVRSEMLVRDRRGDWDGFGEVQARLDWC